MHFFKGITHYFLIRLIKLFLKNSNGICFHIVVFFLFLQKKKKNGKVDKINID